MIADLEQFLRDSATINNLIGGRIERGFIRQGTAYPCLVLNEIDDSPPLYHLEGEPDIGRTTIQVDSWAKDGDNPDGERRAKEIADAVRNRISGYRGDMGDTKVRSCTLTNSTPLDEEPEDGSDYRYHRISQSYDIMYYRAVPDFT